MILLDKVKEFEKFGTPHPLMENLKRERISHESVALALRIPFHIFSYYMLGWENVPQEIDCELNDLMKQICEQDMWEGDGFYGFDLKSESMYYSGKDKY